MSTRNNFTKAFCSAKDKLIKLFKSNSSSDDKALPKIRRSFFMC